MIYLDELLEKHNIPYRDIDNNNVRGLMVYLREEKKNCPATPKAEQRVHKKSHGVKRTSPDTPSESPALSKLYVVENFGHQRVISKQSMEAADLLVGIHNAIVWG